MLEQTILKIQMHLFSVLIVWMTFIRILMITTQAEKEKSWWHDCKHHDKQKFQAIIKLLFIRCRKVNISLAFVTQSYFSVPKDVRLRSVNIWLVTIYDTNQMYFKRLNLSILHWVWLWLIILKTKQIKIKRKIKLNKTNIWSTTRCIIL